MGNDYYNDLVDPTRVSSARSMQTERERVRRVEEGRLKAFLSSPPIVEISKQTQLGIEAIKRQEAQIAELKKQTLRLEEELHIAKVAEAESKKKTKWSIAGFWLTTMIAVASLVVAILAWALPH